MGLWRGGSIPADIFALSSAFARDSKKWSLQRALCKLLQFIWVRESSNEPYAEASFYPATQGGVQVIFIVLSLR